MQRMSFQTGQQGKSHVPGANTGPVLLQQQRSTRQACAKPARLGPLRPLQKLSRLRAPLKQAREPPGSGLPWDLKGSVHVYQQRKQPVYHSLLSRELSAHCSWTKAQKGTYTLSDHPSCSSCWVTRGAARRRPLLWLCSPLPRLLLLPLGLYLALTGAQMAPGRVVGLSQWQLPQS